MLTKKDKKILNQKSMIHNRDILIEDMQKKNEELSNENISEYISFLEKQLIRVEVEAFCEKITV